MATPGGLKLRPTTRFDRDLKRLRKRGKDLGKLRDVTDRLRLGRPLEVRHRDHALSGDMLGWRDCHVEPDWLLIYRVEGTELVLGRTGTHADVFP